MNNFTINKPKTVLLFCCLPFFLAWGQQETKQSFDVNDDVVVELNTSHTNIQFETWRKDKVEIEAFVESESLSKEEQEQIFKDWGLEISYSDNKVAVKTKGFSPHGPRVAAMPPMPPMPPMPKMEMVNVDDLGIDIQEIVGPVLESLSEMPMPPVNIAAFQFDYEAYEKDPEGYMKKFEQQIEENVGEDYERKMEEWGRRLEERMERRSEIMERRAERMEERQERMAERREHIEERMADRREEAAKRYEEEMEAYGKRMEDWGNEAKSGDKKNVKAKRTIIIRMPKKAILKMNVRHGEVKLADNTTNLNANLQYAALVANSIDGEETSVNVSYAPVTIDNWIAGDLSLKYVDACTIQTVGDIKLNANSSDVTVVHLTNNGFIKGSFGELSIAQLGDTFKTLDVILENTNAIVKLPNVAYDIFYTGSNSEFKYPAALQLQQTKSGSREIVKGFSKDRQSPRTITLTAEYSKLNVE